MQQFKEGDRVVYTGERYKKKGQKPMNVGHKGTVHGKSFACWAINVHWDEGPTRPPVSCYPDNLALDEPENSIKNALEVLKKHGTVEFTPHPEPWEGELFVCTAEHYSLDTDRQYHVGEAVDRQSLPPEPFKQYCWRKIKAREVVQEKE